MSNFKTSYPSFTALFSLVAALALDVETEGETLLQKLEGSIALIPQVLAFIPQAAGLATEVTVLKAKPEDMVAGAEVLVTDLSFSSDKAKAIIAAAFPLAESLAGLVPQVSALVTAIKA